MTRATGPISAATCVSVEFDASAVICATSSVDSALSTSSTPGLTRKKMKDTIGPTMREIAPKRSTEFVAIRRLLNVRVRPLYRLRACETRRRAPIAASIIGCARTHAPSWA